MSAVHYMNHGMTACMMPGVPKDWPEGERWSRESKEVTCPACLKGLAFQSDTYEVTPDRNSIKCLGCGMTSYNPHDVEQHYCAHCYVFHDDIWPPARRWWIDTHGGQRQQTYTHHDSSGMLWRFEGGRPVSQLADEVMNGKTTLTPNKP